MRVARQNPGQTRPRLVTMAVRVLDNRRCCVRVVYYPAVAVGTVRKSAGVTRDIMRRLR